MRHFLYTLATLLGFYQTLAATDSLCNLVNGQQYANLFASAEISAHQFINRLYDPIRSLVTTQPCGRYFYDPCGICPTREPWIEAGAGGTFFRGQRGCRGFRFRSYEVTAGWQSSFLRDWTLGVAGSYVYDRARYKKGGGTGKTNTGYGAIYGLYRPGCWYVFTDLVFGYNCNKTKRSSNQWLRARGRPEIYQADGYIEAGFDLGNPCVLFQPFLGFEFDYLSLQKFSETGNNLFNIKVSQKSHTNVHSRLGFHLTAHQCKFKVSFSLDLAWQYRLTSFDHSFHMQFKSLEDSFKVKGSRPSRNSLDAAFTIGTLVCNRWLVFGQAAGQRWQEATSYSFLGGVKYYW